MGAFYHINSQLQTVLNHNTKGHRVIKTRSKQELTCYVTKFLNHVYILNG